MEKLKAELWDKVQYIFRNYYDRMIHASLVYDGNVDLDILRKSIYNVVKHFPILRSTFHSSFLNPHWVVNEDYTVEEMATKVICDDLQESVLSSLSKEISYKSKLQFEIVVHYCGDKSAISVLVNHMCLDGTDFKYCICKIIEGYNLLARGGDIAELQLKDGSRDYSQLYKDMSEEDAEEARKLYKNVSRTGVKNKFDFTDEKDCSTRFNFKKLQSETVQALKAKGKEYDATLNDVFMTAYARAISTRLAPSDDKRLVVTSMKNLRDHIESKSSESITNLTGFMPCVLEELGETFCDTLRMVTEKNNQSKEDKFCGLYGIPLLALAFKLFPYSIAEFAIKLGYENPLIGMSNIGIIPEEFVELEGLKCVDTFVTGATKFKPYIQLTSTTFKGVTTLCIAQKCGDEDERRICELLDAIESQLMDFLSVE
ncbi:MAG: hypothetical protein K2N53_02550 [Clostridia bacterium]|nr:hypothetical protein [Clostridia bacterium]